MEVECSITKTLEIEPTMVRPCLRNVGTGVSKKNIGMETTMEQAKYRDVRVGDWDERELLRAKTCKLILEKCRRR